VDSARVVQLTDTHFSASDGVPAHWPPTLDWLRQDPPDLVVHSGDIVFEDPDDEDDRAFARQLLDDVPVRLVCIPGNHDIGKYGDEADRARRVNTFRETWGDDRFVLDLAGWRLVGADAYLLGDTEHDDWLHSVTHTGAPVLVFVHQPLSGDPNDGWQMTEAARAAFGAAVEGSDMRIVASGHRHTAGRFGRAVWAPSLTVEGDDLGGTDPRCGVVEHVLGAGGGYEVSVVRPWAGERAPITDRRAGRSPARPR
jgi:3',5'-cyclic AMP phosphodiesterase CpdA